MLHFCLDVETAILSFSLSLWEIISVYIALSRFLICIISSLSFFAFTNRRFNNKVICSFACTSLWLNTNLKKYLFAITVAAQIIEKKDGYDQHMNGTERLGGMSKTSPLRPV